MQTLRFISITDALASAEESRLALRKVGVVLRQGATSTWIDEHDPSWPAIEKVCIEHGISHHIRRMHSSEEERAASPYLGIFPLKGRFNPIPWGGYEELKHYYDISRMCRICHTGARQIAPLRLTKAPGWGEHSFLRLSWCLDDVPGSLMPLLSLESLCVKQEIYEAVFKSAGAGCLPVLDAKGKKELVGIVQLQATQSIHVETGSLAAAPCKNCGQIKYDGSEEGFGPAVLGATSGFVESAEWFGYVRSAGHRWFISQELYQRVKLCKGINFMPAASAG